VVTLSSFHFLISFILIYLLFMPIVSVLLLTYTNPAFLIYCIGKWKENEMGRERDEMESNQTKQNTLLTAHCSLPSALSLTFITFLFIFNLLFGSLRA